MFFCNSEPDNIKENKNNSKFIYNELNKADNNKPFSKENCVPCCKWCNFSKNNRSVDEFKEWIKDLYQTSIVEGKLDSLIEKLKNKSSNITV